MKKGYRYSGLQYKILAFLLAAVCLFVGAGGLYLAVGGLHDNLWLENRPYQQTWKCRDAVEDWALTVGDRFYNNPDYDNWEHLLRDTDYRFILLEESTGNVLASYTEGLDIEVPENLKNNPWLYEYNYTMELGPEGSVFEDVYVIDFYRTATREEIWPELEVMPETSDGTVSFQLAGEKDAPRLVDLMTGDVYQVPETLVKRDDLGEIVELVNLPLTDSPLLLMFGDFDD